MLVPQLQISFLLHIHEFFFVGLSIFAIKRSEGLLMSIGAKHISSHCLDIVSLSVLKASVALSYPYLEVTALSGVQSRFFSLPFSPSVATVRCMLSVNKGSEQF